MVKTLLYKVQINKLLLSLLFVMYHLHSSVFFQIHAGSGVRTP